MDLKQRNGEKRRVELYAMELAWLNQHRRTRIGMCNLFDELHELLETCDDERENND